MGSLFDLYWGNYVCATLFSLSGSRRPVPPDQCVNQVQGWRAADDRTDTKEILPGKKTVEGASPAGDTPGGPGRRCVPVSAGVT